MTVDGKPARQVAQDETFDLALVPSDGLAGTPAASFAASPARLNSDVTVVGYPLNGLLGGLNVTRGAVASLKGMGGDATRMQISAPVQPLNSGGPVLDAYGSVVGVVVAKLDAQVVANVFGDIPQNVNFAIRGEIAKLFLFQNCVEPGVTAEPSLLSAETLAERAAGFMTLIQCY